MLACLSCSKEQLSHDTQIATGNPVEMQLTVDTPMSSAVSNNETDINRLRVVVFGSTTAPDAGKLILNKFYSTAPAGNSFKDIITSGKRDIYIIVNEPLSGGGAQLDSYKNIATVGDIRNLSLIYDGAGAATVYSPSEIPMFVRHLDQQILIDSPNVISGTVERVMAKVSMKLNVKNSNFPSGKHVVVDNITIKNLPESSSWIGSDYVGALVNSEKQYIQVVTPEVGYDASSNNTFYVPEYIMANPDNGAYIEIKGHPNGEPNRVNTWKVKLGDAMDDTGIYGDKYNITRNRHYTFTGDIKTYGDMSDLAVKVTVLPWNTVNMDEEVGRYVAFSKVTNATGVDIADGSYLNEMGETIKVSCTTNVGGWYVVMRNAKGDVVYTSTPTEAVTSSTEQTVDLVVPEVLHDEPTPHSTITIYHSLLANESISSVASLRFVQKNGIIPTSVLATVGWPEDKLPAKGLQVAVMGNLQPGDTPVTDDPYMQVKTNQRATIGVESVNQAYECVYGMGKSSTDAMMLSPIEHPAAVYCRAMGPDWYLPSYLELKLFYDYRELLGTPYSFKPSGYWSATEKDKAYGFGVGFLNGARPTVVKNYDINRVRCVRDI